MAVGPGRLVTVGQEEERGATLNVGMLTEGRISLVYVEELRMSTATDTLKTVKVSTMNAIHDLPLLVARDEGFFRDEGLNVEIVKTPGTAQKAADHQALTENIFERTME